MMQPDPVTSAAPRAAAAGATATAADTAPGPVQRVIAQGRRVIDVVSLAGSLWSENRAGRIAAALAFYTLFSLAPILVVATAIAGLVWGREAVQGDLVAQLADIVGAEGGRLLQGMIANAYTSTRTGWAALVGVVAVLVGASAVFAELRMSFQQIWHGAQEQRDAPISHVVLALVKARLRGLAVVVGIGFVLLASLVLSSVLVAIGAPIRQALQEAGLLGSIVAVLPLLASIGVTAVMIGLLLMVLAPGRQVRAQVGVAALVGAVAFELAKSGVSFYLGRSAVTSIFGAAGSLAVLLIWLYAASAVVLLSAVLLRAMSTVRGPVAEKDPTLAGGSASTAA